MADFDVTQPQAPTTPAASPLTDPVAAQQLTAAAMQPNPPAAPAAPPAPPVAPSFTPPSTTGQSEADTNRQRWGTATRPGSFSNSFASALNGPEGSALASTPGGLMKAMVAAAVTAMSEKAPAGPDAGQRAGTMIRNFLAPLAGGPGAFGGAGNAAAAGQRIADAQQKQKMDEFNEKHKRSIEDIKEGVNLALSNAQMIHSQYLMHQTGINDSITEGNSAVETLKKQPAGRVDILGTDLTAGDLKRGIEQHTQDPNTGYDMSTMTPYPTGKKQVGENENGEPIYQATYTLVRAPKSVNITSKEEAKKLFPESQGLDNVDETHPLTVPFALYNSRWQANDTALAIQQASQKAADQAADANQTHAEDVERRQFAGSNIWAQDLARATRNPAYKNNPIMAYLDAYQTLTKDDKMLKQFPNIEKDIRAQIGEKNFENMLGEAQKQQDKLELDKQKAQEKAEADALKKNAGTNFAGDPNATTPQDFFNSLSQSEQTLVHEIGAGRMVIDRLGYLATRKPEILEAVARSFPDFDSSKAASYPATYKEFTSTKANTAGGALNAGGTALQHLYELQQLNTVASHIPHSPSWTAYQNKADTLSTELAKFYGDATIPAIAAIKNTLTSTLPGNREAAITTQAQSMGRKFDSYQTQWENAAPSKAYEAPMPNVSQGAKQARAALDPDYAAAHPEIQTPQAQKQQQATSGVTVNTPNGPFTFKTQQEADAFRAKAGIK